MFKRLKRLWKLSQEGNIPGTLEALEELEGIRSYLDEHTRDITNINTALQRIERKQNRWIEMLNLKREMKEPVSEDNGAKAPDLIQPARPLTEFMPGQIVE